MFGLRTMRRHRTARTNTGSRGQTWLGCYLLSLAVLCGSVTPALSVEVNCTFNLEVSKEGTRKLADHAYRVRNVGVAAMLEQRTADGSWMDIASVTDQSAGGLTTYIHLPEADEDDYFASVAVLTVYQDGRAHLFQQRPHGRLYGDAWTTYGECWPASAGSSP